MKTKAYLFDMDGVLVDNTRYHLLAWQEFARRRGGRATDEQLVSWMGSPGRDFVRRMFEEPLSPARVDELLKEKEALYRELYRPYLSPRPGVVAFLERARRDGVVCTITTGGSRANVDFVLDGTGLRRYFACVLDAGQYARGKPHPDCYLQTAAAVGAEPADCTIFEDAVNGIEAAKAAHIRVVAITGTNSRTTLEAAGPDRIVDSFDELLQPEEAR